MLVDIRPTMMPSYSGLYSQLLTSRLIKDHDQGLAYCYTATGR